MATATKAKPAATPEEKLPTVADLKKQAHDQHVPISDGTLESIGKDMTPQKATAFEEYLKMTASGLYPTLSKQIMAGIKVGHLIDPYRQVFKQMVGDQHEPNFQTDPRFTAALQGGTDPETGHPAPMSLDQWRQHIQNEPTFGWQNTPQAHAQANNFINALHQGFTQEGAANPGGNG